MAIINLKKLKQPVEGMLTREGKYQPAKNRWPGDDDEMMYTISGGNVQLIAGEPEAKIYLPFDSDAIKNNNIQIGEMFSIACRKTAQKGIYYELRRLSDAAEPAPPAADPFRGYPTIPPRRQAQPETSTPDTKLEATLAASITYAEQRKAHLAKVTPAAVAAMPTSQTTQQNNTTAAAETPASGQTQISMVMASLLIASIDAMLLAEQYAKSKGIAVKPLIVEFTAEDARAMTSTLFIQGVRDTNDFAAATARNNAASRNGGASQWRQ